MDLQDVSNVDRYMSFIKDILANAERARLRQGQIPREHPPPQLVIRSFMAARARSIQAGKDGYIYSRRTTQVPAPYPPSVRYVDDLQPLMISRMRLEEHHRGKRATIRILTPPDRINAIMAIAEDEEGTTVLLQLYNQPDEDDVRAEDTIRPESVCIIKEPFFKATSNGNSYSIRVDHVSDIIWLLDGDERIPRKWRKPASLLDSGSQTIRVLGNNAVQVNNWGAAERMYSAAIRAAKTPEEEQLAQLNRSLVNLRLGRPEGALKDASMCSQTEKLSEKTLFRQAKALYALQRFKHCLEKLQELVESYPENTAALAEIVRVRQRLREEMDGVYQFSSMYKQSEATPPIIDCATYIGPVIVRSSPGRGRGLFTTKPVKAGDLLFCEKAFAYVYAGDDSPASLLKKTVLMNLTTKRTVMGGQAHLISQIAQKLYHNHESASVFTDLHHGDYDTVGISEVDGQPIVDTFLIDRIISLNSFGAPRTSLQQFNKPGKDKRNSHTTCGIWPLASHINHSCVINCQRSFIGDMQIVRASQDLDANSELFFHYLPPSPFTSYEETQKGLSHWGFVCSCQLCHDKKSTPQKTLQKRKALNGVLSRTLKTLMDTNTASQILKAQKLVQQLEKTFPNPEEVPYPELWDPYFALGGALNMQGRLTDAIEMMVKGLESLGYKIVASPPRKIDAKRPKLVIEKWGQLNHFVPRILLTLSEAYMILSPALCGVARQYAETAYCIWIGEKETFATTFPELPQGRME
ncbi:hypothetical protein F4775DRAFT_585593 [Biscogniauxia sp. FL1348]|nr:hypothetical protein F4775DRAFT_585593 [Biscogniauxia sp. FL1348]